MISIIIASAPVTAGQSMPADSQQADRLRVTAGRFFG